MQPANLMGNFGDTSKPEDRNNQGREDNQFKRTKTKQDQLSRSSCPLPAATTSPIQETGT